MGDTLKFQAVDTDGAAIPTGEVTWDGTAGATDTSQTTTFAVVQLSPAMNQPFTVRARTNDGVALTAEIVVGDVALEAIGFANSSDAQLYQDNASTPIGVFQVSRTASRRQPAFCVGGRPFSLTARFDVTPSGFGEYVSVKASGVYRGRSYVFPASTLTVNGTSGIYQRTDSGYDATQIVDKFNFSLIFQADLADVTKQDNEYIQVYLIRKAPIDSSALLSVVDLGCSAAQGETTEGAILSDIWSKFTSLSITPVNGTSPLTYWAPGTPFQGGYSVSQMLTGGNGKCGTWSEFFVDVMKVQGSDQYRKVTITAKPINGYTLDAAPLIVKSQAPVQGGVVNPQHQFSDHAVVRKGDGSASGNSYGQIFDPSYGNRYQGQPNVYSVEKLWEDGALYAIKARNSDGTDVLLIHQDGVRQTNFER